MQMTIVDSKNNSNSSRDFHKSSKILVVDDNPAVAEVISTMLSELGFEVEVAKSGREALEHIENKSDFDLVIIDFMMPEMKGDECAELIKNVLPAAKVIFSSGYDIQNDKQYQYNQIFDGFLKKPFSLESLHRTISGSLNKY